MKRLIFALLCTINTVDGSVCSTLCPLTLQNSACDFICGNSEIKQEINVIQSAYDRLKKELRQAQYNLKVLQSSTSQKQHQQQPTTNDDRCEREQTLLDTCRAELAICNSAAVTNVDCPPLPNFDSLYAAKDNDQLQIQSTNKTIKIFVAIAMISTSWILWW